MFLVFFTSINTYAKDLKSLDLISLNKIVQKEKPAIKDRLLGHLVNNLENKKKVNRLITNLRSIDLDLGNYIYTANFVFNSYKSSIRMGRYISQEDIIEDLRTRSELLNSIPIASRPSDYIYLDIFNDDIFKSNLNGFKNKQFNYYYNNNQINLKILFGLLLMLDLDRPEVKNIVNELLSKLIRANEVVRKESEENFLKLTPKLKNYSNKLSNVYAAYLIDDLKNNNVEKANSTYEILRNEYPDVAKHFKVYFKKKQHKSKNISTFFTKTSTENNRRGFPFGSIFLVLLLIGIGYYMFNKIRFMRVNRVSISNTSKEHDPSFDELFDLSGVGN